MSFSVKDAFTMDPVYDMGTYEAPSWTVDDNFFKYDPKTTGGIDWSDIYANPDVLKGYGDDYNPFGLKDTDSDLLNDILNKDQENKYLEDQKFKTGVSSPSSSEVFQQVTPSVTLTRDGMPVNPYGSAAKYGAMRMAGQNPSLAQTLGAGVQSAAMNMVLGAIPGVGPALAAANALGVDIPGVLKGGARMAGDALGGIAKGVGGLFKGIGSIFCDERLKVDIAPLESTEVNDELAQMAFFVKGIRECS